MYYSDHNSLKLTWSRKVHCTAAWVVTRSLELKSGVGPAGWCFIGLLSEVRCQEFASCIATDTRLWEIEILCGRDDFTSESAETCLRRLHEVISAVWAGIALMANGTKSRGSDSNGYGMFQYANRSPIKEWMDSDCYEERRVILRAPKAKGQSAYVEAWKHCKMLRNAKESAWSPKWCNPWLETLSHDPKTVWMFVRVTATVLVTVRLRYFEALRRCR